MSVNDDLVPILKKLRLSGLLQTLDLRVRQAVEDNLSQCEFLYRVLHDEVERRDSKQLNLRLSRASFEHAKSLEDFDFTFNEKIPKGKVIELATVEFVARKENVLLCGPSGVGKSHIAQGIGMRACRAGYSVLFTGARQMLAQLRASRADGTYDRRLLRFVGPDLLIVDDLGLFPLQADEPSDLYEIVRQRYERASMIITSNRTIDEWYPLFKDPLLASAALDRLRHHAHQLDIDGDSYRGPRKKSA